MSGSRPCSPKQGPTWSVTGRRADRLEQLAARLETAVTVVPGDLRDPAFRTALVRRVDSVHGRLDVLVNNAGTCDGGPIEDQRLDELSDVLDLDLVAPLDLCRLAAPLLFAATSASVVNVASIFGLVASREPMAAYNVSKAGLVGLTRQLAAQWGDRGVRVNALAPGFFPTDLTGGLSDPDATSRHRAPDVARPHAGSLRAGRPAPVPCIGGIELHDRAGADDRRWLDRGLSSVP